LRLSARDLAALGKDHPLVKRLAEQGHLTPTATVGAPTLRPKNGASQGEEEFALQLRALRLPESVREHRFHPTRAFRFDFAWPDLPCGRKLAVEIEGGIHSGGRHVRPQGYKRDLEKYNSAVALGWTLLRFSSAMVFSGEAVQAVQEWLNNGSD
jgi:very-short-patch-repair endonuclease